MAGSSIIGAAFLWVPWLELFTAVVETASCFVLRYWASIILAMVSLTLGITLQSLKLARDQGADQQQARPNDAAGNVHVHVEERDLEASLEFDINNPVFIAPISGEQIHIYERCGPLKRAKKIRTMLWCSDCVEKFKNEQVMPNERARQ